VFTCTSYTDDAEIDNIYGDGNALTNADSNAISFNVEMNKITFFFCFIPDFLFYYHYRDLCQC